MLVPRAELEALRAVAAVCLELLGYAPHQGMTITRLGEAVEKLRSITDTTREETP